MNHPRVEIEITILLAAINRKGPEMLLLVQCTVGGECHLFDRMMMTAVDCCGAALSCYAAWISS